jgi:glycosyltransferase involved in cell wall biosynthesis
MSWFPNVDAIDFFCKKAYPTLKKLIPDIKFDVVGRDPKQTIQKLNEDSDILITGEVPDVRPFISNSDVCIVPLRIGGGTRLKILEYFAMGIPVISTSVGVEGIDAINGEHLIIEDDISKFPDRIIELLNDQEFAKYLAKNGRKLVEEKYSWSQYGENLNQLYFDILKHR